MNLDARIPMGWMFTLTGLILAAFGLVTNGSGAVYARSLGINVNLWWGLALLAFGLALFVLGRRGTQPAETKRLTQPGKDKARRTR